MLIAAVIGLKTLLGLGAFGVLGYLLLHFFEKYFTWVEPEDLSFWGILLPGARHDRSVLWSSIALAYKNAALGTTWNYKNLQDGASDENESYIWVPCGNLELFVGLHLIGKSDLYVSWNLRGKGRWSALPPYVPKFNELNRSRAFASAALDVAQQVVLEYTTKQQLSIPSHHLQASGTLGAVQHARPTPAPPPEPPAPKVTRPRKPASKAPSTRSKGATRSR